MIEVAKKPEAGPPPRLPETDDATRREFLIEAAISLAVIVLALSGCGGGGGAGGEGSGRAETRVVEHPLGSTEVPVDPERVVAVDSLTPAYLSALDVPSVGACTEGDYVPPLLEDYYEGVERFPNCQTALPYESVAALDPDLIVAVEDQITSVDEDGYERLSEIAPTVAIALSEDRVGMLADYGEVLDQAEEARTIIDGFYASLEGLALEGTFTMPALFGEGSFDLMQDNFVLVGLLERAGMRQVPDTTGIEGYDPNDNRIRELSFERVELLSGDYLFPVVATTGDPQSEVESLVGDNPLWQRLPAVEAGRVVPVNSANAFGGAGLAGFRAEIENIADAVKANPRTTSR